MYVLQNNVEIVEGAKNGCIYDLNTGKLYNLTGDYMAFLRRIAANEAVADIPGELLDYLLKEGIAVSGDDLVDKLIPFKYSGHPEFAWLEITQNCNLICRHCYEGSSRGVRIPHMLFDDFKYAVDCINSIGIERIQLVGGEPLMHPDIELMIDYVHGKFKSIEIFTNGTLLSERLLDVIKSEGISLAFSVYSNDSGVHDSVTRTKGSHSLTASVIAKAVSMGISVRVSSVEMIGVPKFEFAEPDVTHKTDFPRLTGRADLSLYSDDMLRRKLITKKTFIKPIDPAQYFKNRVVHNCFGDLLYVDCNLNAFPCAMERRVSYGNLRSQAVKDIPFSKAALMTKDHIEGCKDCEYRYACYDCRPDSNNAPINSKPWYCTYDQQNGTWIDPEEFIVSLRSMND